MFEKPKDTSDLIKEKLTTLTDEQIQDMMNDPLDVISTTKGDQESVWKTMSMEEIKEVAKAEAEKRGII